MINGDDTNLEEDVLTANANALDVPGLRYSLTSAEPQLRSLGGTTRSERRGKLSTGITVLHNPTLAWWVGKESLQWLEVEDETALRGRCDSFLAGFAA
jgi:hypothetical protein